MDALAVFRSEFDADEGSFLLGLRAGGRWDRAAFTRLERSMRVICEHYQGEENVDRWLAEGFHSISRWVREWTSAPGFPRPLPVRYHEACLRRVDDLTDWFFQGHHNYPEPHEWADL
jgi:hypothetical protein